MQNFEIDYGDLEELTINEIKSRISLMGVNIDFEIHSNDYYKNIYMELMKDPENRQTLRRYGILKPKESSNITERLISKKRLRGIDQIN
jgi:hypothetical protein